MTEKIIRICDVCINEIAKEQQYINAGSYGAHFHNGCFNKLTALGLVKALGLDDIRQMKDDKWDQAIKIYTFSTNEV